MNDYDDLKPSEQVKYPVELPKAGWHPAVCCQIHSIGYQKFGNDISAYPQVVFLFELAAKRQEGDFKGQPFILSSKMSNVLSKPDAKKRSNLTEMLSGWTGRDMTDAERENFSCRTMLYKDAYVNVKHETGKDGVVRPKIAAIGPLPEGILTVAPTFKETPKWITESKGKSVTPNKESGPRENAPLPEEDQLPF